MSISLLLLLNLRLAYSGLSLRVNSGTKNMDTLNDSYVIADELFIGLAGNDTLNSGSGAGFNYFTFIVDEFDKSFDTINSFRQDQDSIFITNTQPDLSLLYCYKDYLNTKTILIYDTQIFAEIQSQIVDELPVQIFPNIHDNITCINLTTEPTSSPTMSPTAIVTWISDILEIEVDTIFVVGNTIVHADGAQINAFGLNDLICKEGPFVCEGTIFDIGAPLGEQVQVQFETLSFHNGLINIADLSKLTCRERACIGSIFDKVSCDPAQMCEFVCDGVLSCSNIKAVLPTAYHVTCKLDQACIQSSFEFGNEGLPYMDYNNGISIIECDGLQACQSVNITEAKILSEILCIQSSSCNLMSITQYIPLSLNNHVINITCSGQSSCEGIDYIINGDAQITLFIDCNGIDACKNFQITLGANIVYTSETTIQCQSPSGSACTNALIDGIYFDGFTAAIIANSVHDCNNYSYTPYVMITILSLTNITVIGFIFLLCKQNSKLIIDGKQGQTVTHVFNSVPTVAEPTAKNETT